MSLSSHIRETGSPVWAWFEQRLPATRTVATQANRELQAGSARCMVAAPKGSDNALVGTAVDFMLRAHLAADALDETAATIGASLLDRKSLGLATSLEREAANAVRDLQPCGRELDDDEWTALCTACAALARFEQSYRDIATAISTRYFLQARAPADHAAFVATVASRATLDDIATLGRVAVDDHRDLRSGRQLDLNPVFAQSRALGGADADLIVDGVLLDWKSSAKTGVVRRRVLWQLLGYAFADTDDRYGIERLGVSALRWRRRVIWPVSELLDLLAGDGTPQLAELRAEFAEVAVLARRRARPTA